LLKFNTFDTITREKHKKDLEKYETWKKEYIKQSNEYGSTLKTEEEREEEIKI
jgi:hypothetical protein